MNPNNSYYPQSWGAAQMTGYQPAGPAAPASISPGPTEQVFRQLIGENSEETLAELVRQTGWRPEWIKRLVHLRAMGDPQHPGARRHMPFEMIYDIMQGEFPGMKNLDAEALRVGFANYIRRPLGNFRAVHKLDAAAAAALAQRQQRAGQPSSVDPQGARPDAPQNAQMSFQRVHASSYGAPQPGPGASYGGSQSGYGGQQAAPQPGFHSAPYGGSQPGHHRQQFEVPQSGFGGPYQNTQGTTQYLPPVASTNPRPDNQLPPIAPIAQVPTNQGPPPMEPAYRMPEQNYNSEAPQAMMPDVQQPMTLYRTGHSGHNSQARHEGDVSEHEAFDLAYQFTPEEREWLLNEGIYLEPGHRANHHFYERFREAFGDHRLPSKRRVLDEFGSMRTSR